MVNMSGQAQTLKQFNGQFNISKVQSLSDGSGNYIINGDFNDLGNVFIAGQSRVGDKIIDKNGNTFEVILSSVNGPLINTTSKAFDSNPPILGLGMIYRPTNGGFPLITKDTPSSVLTNALNTATISIDNSIPTYDSGTALPAFAWSEGDVVLYLDDSEPYIFSNGTWSVCSSSVSYSNPVTDTPAGSKGDVVKSYWDKNYYVYDGSAWGSLVTANTLPTSNDYGDIFYVTTEKKLYMMGVDGDWLCLNSSTMPGGATNDRPTTANPSDFYYDTDTNILYVFDTNSIWKEVSVNGSTPVGIINPDPTMVTVNDGDLFYNTSDKRLYVYNGTSWISMDNALASGQVYVGNASNVATPVTMYGDATINPNGKLSIGEGAISDEKLDKGNIPLSGFDIPLDNVSMGTGTSNYRIVNMANPTDKQDAATKNYVDILFSDPTRLLALASGSLFVGNASGKAVATSPNKISISKFGSAETSISMGNGTTNFKIKNLAAPVDGYDAVNKNYINNLNFSCTRILVPEDSMLVGTNIGTAIPVSKKAIPLSDFGTANTNVLMGNELFNYKITNMKDPEDAQDAVTKNYVDNKIIDTDNIPLSSGEFFVGNASNHASGNLKSDIPISGFGVAVADVSFGGYKLVEVAAPENDNDAVNKKYIEDLFATPQNSLALPAKNIFVGNASGRAEAVAKNTISINGFGAAEGNVVLGNGTTQYNINYLADPMYAQDAATKNYVDTKVANPSLIELSDNYMLVGNAGDKAEEVAVANFPVSRFGTATANLVMGNGANYKITNLSDPTDLYDAATKNYVDEQLALSSSIDLVNGKFLVGNSSGKAAAVGLSGDATIDNTGALTIAADAVTADKINVDVAGTGLKQNSLTGALEVDATSIVGGSISSTDLVVGGGANAALADVLLTIADGAVSDAKLDKVNISLSGFGVAADTVDMGSNRLTNLATPTVAADAATKAYVDNAVSSSTTISGKLYEGTAADFLAFTGLTWSAVSASTEVGSAVSGTICTLSTSGYTWIAYPVVWGNQDFFYMYDGETYKVIDGFQKRIILAADTGSVDYLLWLFKTTPDREVKLIAEN